MKLGLFIVIRSNKETMIEQRMEKCISNLKTELSKIRTDKPNSQLFDGVTIDYYGNKTSITIISNIKIIDSRTISIIPFEKQFVTDIYKAIQTSSLGVNPNLEGSVIRINLPILTEDRRKELVKVCNKISEESKIAIRNIRRDENEKIKKEKLSVDVENNNLQTVQKITDEYIKIVCDAMEAKQKEILNV